MTATVPSEQRMANDIARNLRHLPRERAAAEIAGHIGRFWDPRMRARLFEYADAGENGLDPLVVAAVELLR
ncbi:formate dehydrogenase subunit delta [Streptomyces aquilus]|uniref:formate dehydrogenase subunit delta n=1 Tax=Streptomyces aquilus TaxID=2548456 RepID=UPI00367EEE36